MDIKEVVNQQGLFNAYIQYSEYVEGYDEFRALFNKYKNSESDLLTFDFTVNDESFEVVIERSSRSMASFDIRKDGEFIGRVDSADNFLKLITSK